MKTVLTIGYEGAAPEDFIATLKKAGVDMVLDIRELAISRRKGFAKNALKASLEQAGIAYQHEKDLGAPKPIRHRLRDDNDYSAYFAAFETYIQTQQQKMEELIKTLPDTIILLCYERDYKTCHRSVVAAKFGEIIGAKPRHLGVAKDAAKHLPDYSLFYSGQSLSAA